MRARARAARRAISDADKRRLQTFKVRDHVKERVPTRVVARRKKFKTCCDRVALENVRNMHADSLL